MLGERLTEAGVDTETRTFEGVTHDFFGMGAVVPEGNEAVGFAPNASWRASGRPKKAKRPYPLRHLPSKSLDRWRKG